MRCSLFPTPYSLEMPELPEVETIVRDLDAAIRDATIADVEVIRPDVVRGDLSDFVAGASGSGIRGITRRAKNLVFELGNWRLVVNLGMTGRMLVLDSDADEPSHIAVRFRLEDGRRLLYRDVRRFGRLEFMAADAWKIRSGEMGVEPLCDAFTPDALHERLAPSRVAVKTRLMDGRQVVGVGNIYASEALFRAGIDPRRPSRSVTMEEAARLHRQIRAVLTEAIEHRGTTLLDYRDANGRAGGFRAVLRVYGRQGEPCVRCGEPIRRTVQGGRSTFFCPQCQG